MNMLERAMAVLTLILAAGLAAACGAGPAVDEGPWDLLITGGTVIDGTGGERYRADVAVRGDRIVRVSRAALPHEPAARVDRKSVV